MRPAVSSTPHLEEDRPERVGTEIELGGFWHPRSVHLFERVVDVGGHTGWFGSVTKKTWHPDPEGELRGLALHAMTRLKWLYA